jgi:hypothetical protein
MEGICPFFGRYLLIGFLSGAGSAAVAWRGPVAVFKTI